MRCAHDVAPHQTTRAGQLTPNVCRRYAATPPQDQANITFYIEFRVATDTLFLIFLIFLYIAFIMAATNQNKWQIYPQEGRP